ncbi:MAG: RepB family plasmid replication initiator protein, partial [Candidatus Electrothrix sp. ATG2]|nr:RepB family plasmid replication initiator protein [Candidatus Electrothrix sp. ATG2]
MTKKVDHALDSNLKKIYNKEEREMIRKKPGKSYIAVQSNRLVEASYTLTVVEQKIILAMVSMIHPDDADFFSYEMKLKDLAELLNINIKYAYHEIDNITRCLRKRELHIPEENGWLNTGWVSSCRYNGKTGTVSFRFDPELKPYLLRLKSEFTKYRISLVVQFKSIYSIRIYQLLKQYKSIGYREFKVDELKEILGIKQNEYREFKRFRGRV